MMSAAPQLSPHLAELKQLSTGQIVDLAGMVDNNCESDQYFLSSVGVIVHAIRSPFAYLLDKRSSAPTALELFDLEGNFIGARSKRYIPALQWASQWSASFRGADFIKLRERPSFIAPRNNDYSKVVAVGLAPN